MTTQIKPFKEKDFETLINQINEFNKIHNGFSTQIFPTSPWSEYWFAAVYYDSKDLKESKVIPPSEKQLKHLKENKKYLESKGIKIDSIKTKKEATLILGKLWGGEL